MAAWLLKTEPGEYALADLERDGRAAWSGVSNAAAQKNLRAMRPGERCFVYHTGKERAVVGVASVDGEPYADADDPKLVVVDVRFESRLSRPVTLAQVKAEPSLAEWPLVRQGRLSVVPTPAEVWKRVMQMAGER